MRKEVDRIRSPYKGSHTASVTRERLSENIYPPSWIRRRMSPTNFQAAQN